VRIGIDGSCLANRRGFGRFARQLLTALAAAGSGHEFVVFVDGPSADSVAVPEPFRAVRVDVRQAPSHAASARGRRGLGDMLTMGRAVAKEGLDLMFFPASYTFFPVWACGRVVVTLHDTLALAHPELVFPTWRGRLAWTVKEHAAVRWADLVLTVSEASRRDVSAWFGLPDAKVRVVGEGPAEVFRPIPAGPDSDSAQRRHGLDTGERYLLYVGGLSPHKNLPRLIEAFARVEARDVRLVLVGDLGDVFHTHVPALREAVARHGLERRVTLAGFVPDTDLVHLYNRAVALVQPSLLEGFGLPAVEAMACGTPVLSSRAGSLPEVVGDGGLFFEPTDEGAIVGAIRAVLANPGLRAELSRKALAQAGRHTWDAAARALLACFEELRPGRALGRSA
jgi:glycosyltransferase involved in cell wall biosynthesis